MAVRKLTCAGATCVESTDGETIEYRIQQLLADNNAGNISAADVRNNLIDIVDSVIENVASGDFSSSGKPFKNDLELKVNVDPETEAEQGGTLYVGSGVYFDTNEAGQLGLAAGPDRIQNVPYPGPGSISHAQLEPDSLITGDPHTQYVGRSGSLMTGNLGMGGYDSVSANWINSIGPNETSQTLGIKFVNQGNTDIGGDATKEHVVLGSGTTLEFDRDSSKIASAVPAAHAFIRFQGANPPVVQSSYNVQSIKRIAQGKYEIYFKPSAVFDHSNYVVVAHANGTSTANSVEDMDLVNAACVERSGDVFSLAVQNDGGNYVDSFLNDIVVFGIASGVNSVEHPIASVIT